MPGDLTFKRLQEIQFTWAQENFGDQEAWKPLLGAVEELGEVSRAHLKGAQGIRGTQEEWAQQGQVEVGDVIIYLAEYCSRQGWDLGSCVEQALRKLSDRDWRQFPETGEVDPVLQTGSDASIPLPKPPSLKAVVRRDSDTSLPKQRSQSQRPFPWQDQTGPQAPKRRDVLEFTGEWQGEGPRPEPPPEVKKGTLTAREILGLVLGLTQKPEEDGK